MHTFHNQNKKTSRSPGTKIKIIRVPDIHKIKKVNFLNKNKSSKIQWSQKNSGVRCSLTNWGQWRGKYTGISSSFPQRQSRFIASWKLCLNFCSLK